MIALRLAEPGGLSALGVLHVMAWREAYPGIVPDLVLARLDPE
jgi:hypothetical protein